MKKFVPLLLIFLSLTFYAQNKKEDVKKIGFISGKIVDFTTKKNLPYVNIICKNKLGVIVNGGITNAKGVFSIHNLPLETIFIDIQYIGFKTIHKEIELSKNQSKVNLKTIYLIEDENTLNEVVIQSENTTIIQKIDRKVVNVGKDLVSSGGNSLQLLENIPSVQVNFQNETISLRGNSNVRVLIDGKPSNLSPSKLLKQIPSSSIKSVELITNPSAKYNPEGMSGIINIILKKNTEIGFNGSLSMGAEHSINTRPTGSLNLNYRAGKVNVYANYGIDTGKFETFSTFYRTDKNLNQKIDYLDNSVSNYLKTGVDIYINKKNTFSFFTTQNFVKTDFSINTIIKENANTTFNAPNLSKFDTKEQAYNFDYKYNIDDKGQNLEFEFNFTKTTNPQDDFVKELINPNSKIYNYTNTITNNTDTFLANLDYTKPIKGGSVDVGFEIRVQNMLNTIQTDQEIETNTIPTLKGNSKFTYDRNIYAAYISYSKEFKKFNFQGGLRYENFTVDGLFSNTQQTNTESYKNNLNTLYPSAFLTYVASDKNEFQLGYSKRVDRPGIDQVTPIQEWTSPLSISIGNRNLNPQFTNSIEFNYSRTLPKGYLTLGTFYRATSNKIGRIIQKDAANNNRQILSYANYDTADSYGIEFSSSLKLTKWWSFRPSSSLYIQDSQGIINNVKESIKNTKFNIVISNSFKASKKVNFQLSSVYRGRNQNVQFLIDPYFVINAAAQLSVLKDKGAITLRGTDIFDGYKLDFLATNPFNQTGKYTLEYSAVYLGFSYDFGKGKNRERNRKYRENNETQGSGGVL